MSKKGKKDCYEKKAKGCPANPLEEEEDTGVFDNDLADENLANNIPEADLQDLS